MKENVKKKLDEVIKEYHKNDLSMGDLLADFPTDGLSIDEAHEVYMRAQSYANADKFYRAIGEEESKLINCLDEAETIELP